MIRLSAVQLLRGARVLLDDANLLVHAGQKVGLVGENGAGKSSLFALLRGQLQVDRGEVDIAGDPIMAWVEQEVEASERSVLEFTLDGDTEFRDLQRRIVSAQERDLDGCDAAELHARFEAIGGYTRTAEAAQLLAGLGFQAARQQQPVASFSGGWRMRINLARALLKPSQILLLDEPTNHLDLETVTWLENWLKRYPGTLLVISHDREFLDALVDTVAHIEHGRITAYRGNYSAFERLRSEQLIQQQTSFEKQERQRAHLQKFVDRFRAKASKAKQAQSRIKALEKLQIAAPLQAASGIEFHFFEPAELTTPFISFEDVTAGYGDVTILKKIVLDLQPGARLGLLGLNGAGKSTLVKLLAGELAPQSGRIHKAEKLRIGYFAQHQLESLDLQASPLLHLQRLSPEATEQALRDYLGGFGFRGDMTLAPVAPFSGGEKTRLALALLIWQKPDLVLLDEPTNHLDMVMRNALEMALQEFAGAVVVVSHDRHMLRSVVDEFYLVHDGVVGRFDGDLDDYARWQTQQSGAQAAEAAAPAERSQPRNRKRLEAEFRQSLSPVRKQIEKLESELERQQAALARVDEQLNDADLYTGDRQEELQRLMKDQGTLRKALENTEEQWLVLQEQVEEATRRFQQELA